MVQQGGARQARRDAFVSALRARVRVRGSAHESDVVETRLVVMSSRRSGLMIVVITKPSPAISLTVGQSRLSACSDLPV